MSGLTERLTIFRSRLSRARKEGPLGVARHLALRAAQGLDLASVTLELDPADIASSEERRPAGQPAPVIGSARIAWVCQAPSPGSGGHTTLFRMIAGMTERGHRNTIALYDPRGDDPLRHAGVLPRHWPWLGVGREVDVVDVSKGLGGFDAIVASSWGTAHVVARRAPATARIFYFIQDFEPYFFPHGALYALAEDTYRFGFRNVALGNMVFAELSALGVESSWVPFGRDTSVYSRQGDARREGVCVYVRKGNDRRGFLLAKAAMERFHALHPEQPIHVYGDRVSDWNMPIHNHGHLSPTELNGLYNQVIGGLALSFTNISLIAAEMLAAGAIPVINDAASARADLSNPSAVWAAPTPSAIARALSGVVAADDGIGRSLAAAAHLDVGWSATQAAVCELIESDLAGAFAPDTSSAI